MTETAIKRRVLPAQLRPLHDLATAQGWTVTVRRNGHLRWRHPSGAQVFTSATTSDWRAVHKIKRDLRNNGLELP